MHGKKTLSASTIQRRSRSMSSKENHGQCQAEKITANTDLRPTRIHMANILSIRRIFHISNQHITAALKRASKCKTKVKSILARITLHRTLTHKKVEREAPKHLRSRRTRSSGYDSERVKDCLRDTVLLSPGHRQLHEIILDIIRGGEVVESERASFSSAIQRLVRLDGANHGWVCCWL